MQRNFKKLNQDLLKICTPRNMASLATTGYFDCDGNIVPAPPALARCENRLEDGTEDGTDNTFPPPGKLMRSGTCIVAPDDAGYSFLDDTLHIVASSFLGDTLPVADDPAWADWIQYYKLEFPDEYDLDYDSKRAPFSPRTKMA